MMGKTNWMLVTVNAPIGMGHGQPCAPVWSCSSSAWGFTFPRCIHHCQARMLLSCNTLLGVITDSIKIAERTGGDSGEMIMAADKLGVAHPPVSPLHGTCACRCLAPSGGPFTASSKLNGEVTPLAGRATHFTSSLPSYLFLFFPSGTSHTGRIWELSSRAQVSCFSFGLALCPDQCPAAGNSRCRCIGGHDCAPYPQCMVGYSGWVPLR